MTPPTPKKIKRPHQIPSPLSANWLCAAALQHLSRLTWAYKSAWDENLGTSQVFSEYVSCPQCVCGFLNSPEYSWYIWVLFNILISQHLPKNLPQFFFLCLTCLLYTWTLIFYSRHLWVVRLPCSFFGQCIQLFWPEWVQTEAST